MPPVFGRFVKNPHPYDKCLVDLLGLSSGDKALARNLMYDFRVGSEREKVFDTFCLTPLSGSDLRNAVVDYFYGRVRNTDNPDYIDELINADNIDSGIANIRQKI